VNDHFLIILCVDSTISNSRSLTFSILIISLSLAPNSPIASAKKRVVSNHSDSLSSPNGKKSANGDESKLSSPFGKAESFGKGIVATLTALFAPTPKYDDETDERLAGGSHTPEAVSKFNAPDSENSKSTASTSTDGDGYSIGKNAGDDDEIGEDELADEEDETFNPYLYISGLPPLDRIHRHSPALPPNTTKHKFTLTLDLDETLVHCSVEPIPKPDIVFPVNFNGVPYKIYARKRPYLDYFLQTVATQFEVIVFTASQKIYADKLLDFIDPTGTLVKHRLFRDSCACVQGNYIKDLQVCGRDLSTNVLVDNSPHAYAYHIDNGIPIESWFDDDSDTELLKLVGFLRRVSACSDARPVIREHFKTYHLVDRAARGLKVRDTAPPF
jgi:Dullard-like phosphatase family protein